MLRPRHVRANGPGLARASAGQDRLRQASAEGHASRCRSPRRMGSLSIARAVAGCNLWRPSMKATTLLARTLMLALLAMPVSAQVTPADEKVPCRNYKDVLALFDHLGYTTKAWQAGIREIPRVYLDDVPDTWHERSAKGLSVGDKKKLFSRPTAQFVFPTTERILGDGRPANALTEPLPKNKGVPAAV